MCICWRESARARVYICMHVLVFMHMRTYVCMYERILVIKVHWSSKGYRYLSELEYVKLFVLLF